MWSEISQMDEEWLKDIGNSQKLLGIGISYLFERTDKERRFGTMSSSDPLSLKSPFRFSIQNHISLK